MSIGQSRSRLGNAVKKARARATPVDEDPDVVEARKDLAADKVEAFIAAHVATAPPLNPEVVERLSSLLRQSALREHGVQTDSTRPSGPRRASTRLPKVER